jgi:hypothetical protein
MDFYCKFITAIVMLFLLCYCSSNKHQIANTNVAVEYNEIFINLIDSIDSVDFEDAIIICPYEPKIKYGLEMGNHATNITLQNPNVMTELNGLAMVAITFDNMDSLQIEDIKLRSLQLKEIITDSIVFDYDMYLNNFENANLDFYREKLTTIIKNFKFWLEDNDKQHSLHFSKRNVVYFSVKVICSN